MLNRLNKYITSQYCCLLTAILAFNFTTDSSALPRINEIMSNNDSTIADSDGDFSDWIELHNPDEEDINLEGYYLTDNSNNLTTVSYTHLTLPTSDLV